MSKRKKSVPVQLRAERSELHVGTIDSLTVTRSHMPKYNGFQCRGGLHGSKGYNRRRAKEQTRRLIEEG